MALEINLRHLDRGAVELRGELAIEALDLDPRDDLVQFPHPLRYALTVERLGAGLIVTGRLELPLRCICVRCLCPSDRFLTLADWACHIPLEGEDRAAITHDAVDLTPYVREDILLALPQHPVCESGCRGRPSAPCQEVPQASLDKLRGPSMSLWAELDKLEF